MLPSANTASRAVIVGGGLAGMVIANELRKQNVPVLLLEKERRMGGKAGADYVNGMYEEHGYHVFPTWYANTHALIREVGILGNLVPITKFHYLLAPDAGEPKRRGIYPDPIVFYQLDSLRAYWKNVFSGILPWYESLLSFYAVLDLLSQPFSTRRFLDRVSVNGFLRSRIYASDSIAEFHQQSVLQASAIPNYELSAMTMQNLVHCWTAAPAPLFSILNGNLQEKFINPLEQHIRRRGADIRMETAVTRLVLKGTRVSAVKLQSGGNESVEELGPDDVCIMTTPPEVTSTFVTDELVACEESNCPQRGEFDPLGSVNYLKSAPMAAFQFYLRRKIPGIPAEHVNLYGSKFGLSFIDVSHTWEDMENTTLSVIASDFEAFKHLRGDEASRYILKELQRFVPEIRDDDVSRVHPEPNVRTPLFLNTVGAWHYRPATRTRIRNLYVAGDYCRSDADLTTMESAVISARQTAAAVLEDLGMNGDSARPIILRKPFKTACIALKWLLLPAALALHGLAWLFLRKE